MRLPLRDLPSDRGDTRRPVLDVAITGDQPVELPCLIDTGALRTRLPEWAARNLGIDLNGLGEELIGLGGAVITSSPVPVVINTAAGPVASVVWFCRGWHSEFGLLGQEGFLEHYRFTLDVKEGWFALQPH